MRDFGRIAKTLGAAGSAVMLTVSMLQAPMNVGTAAAASATDSTRTPYATPEVAHINTIKGSSNGSLTINSSDNYTYKIVAMVDDDFGGYDSIEKYAAAVREKNNRNNNQLAYLTDKDDKNKVTFYYTVNTVTEGKATLSGLASGTYSVSISAENLSSGDPESEAYGAVGLSSEVTGDSTKESSSEVTAKIQWSG